MKRKAQREKLLFFIVFSVLLFVFLYHTTPPPPKKKPPQSIKAKSTTPLNIVPVKTSVTSSSRPDLALRSLPSSTDIGEWDTDYQALDPDENTCQGWRAMMVKWVVKCEDDELIEPVTVGI